MITQIVGILAGLFSLLAMLFGAFLPLIAFETSVESGFVFPPIFMGGLFLGVGFFGAWKCVVGVVGRN